MRLTVETVTLNVRDLEGLVRFYSGLIGLEVLSHDGSGAALGVEGRALLHLRRDPHASEQDPGEPGLYHTAFLLPSRMALGAWLAHAAAAGLRLTGAADHGVSEALYCDDPEGNGIEVYADRPARTWQRQGELVLMTSDPLDLGHLQAAAHRWEGAPSATVIGHVHLRGGDLAQADAFWAERLGLSITRRRAQAHFYASGAYHHHVAVNTWRNRGIRVRPEGRLGLAEVAYAVEMEGGTDLPGIAEGPGAARLRDPSGLDHLLIPARPRSTAA